MFQVVSVSPLDDHWEDRDAVLFNTVGRRSDYAGTTTCSNDRDRKTREHTWLIPEFNDAIALMRLLNKLDKVKATVREHNSYAP